MRIARFAPSSFAISHALSRSAGVPAITTDVGACRELIEGFSAEDRALGAAGAVVPIANPGAFSQAALTLLTNDTLWQGAQRAGLERVQRYYAKHQMIDRYRLIYERAAASPDAGPSTDAKAAGTRCPFDHASASVAPRRFSFRSR